MSINALFLAGLRKPSSLRWRVARMISTSSLAAFTTEVSRTPSLAAPRAAGRAEAPAAEPVSQRKLETLPDAPPAKPMPRGSLLDLRV